MQLTAYNPYIVFSSYWWLWPHRGTLCRRITGIVLVHS